jgi:hypothetical protein
MEQGNTIVAKGLQLAWLTLKDLALDLVGRSMNWLHAPAKLRPFEYVDPDTDETIYLYTDKRLSVLCVGNRRYYFDRITGRLDGTSSSMVDIAGGIELAD